MTDTQFYKMPDGRTIACRHTSGSGPAIVFLPGYMSDMAGGKATATFDWAREHGRACLLLDYSGCGESAGKDRGGDFADGTLSRWRDEVRSGAFPGPEHGFQDQDAPAAGSYGGGAADKERA